jgi:hypothetical protein
MKTYRIFTRDRGRKYSALVESRGVDPPDAVRRARGVANLKTIPGMLKAIEWPPNEIGKRWIEENT